MEKFIILPALAAIMFPPTTGEINASAIGILRLQIYKSINNRIIILIIMASVNELL